MATPDSPSAGVWPDDAITSPSEDKLDRKRFATMVTRRIESTQVGSDSVVFGLVGPWGSGKTSVINLIRGELADDWGVAIFSPWAVGESSSLSDEFLKALLSALGTDEGTKDARKSVSEYLAWGVPLLKLIPAAGDTAADLAEKILTTVGKRKSWIEQFEETSDALKKAGRKILIIADDVDRLIPSELPEFLKLIRLLGRFPNVHYLIAYDQISVEEILNLDSASRRGASYMEKIVQHPFELPPIAEATSLELALESINLVATRVPVPMRAFADERASELVGILARGLTTARSHFRFRSQLDTYATLMSFDEVDFLDFAAITFLRIQFHPLFEAVQRWEYELRTGTRVGDSFAKGGESIEAGEWRKMVSDVLEVADIDTPLLILSFLFPSVSVAGLTYHIDHEQAIAKPEYFSRYFHLGVPPDDVEDRTVAEGLDSLVGNDTTSQAVSSYAEKIDRPPVKRARLAAEKGRVIRRAAVDGSWSLVEFLDERVRARPDTESGSYTTVKGVLEAWLAREVFLAYQTNKADRTAILGRFGEDRSLSILRRITALASSERSVVAQMRRDFAEHFLDGLPAKLEKELEGGRLRLVLSLIVDAEGPGAISGIFDDDLTRTPELFVQITAAMVKVETWSGAESVEELVFERGIWTALFSESQRAELVRLLPSSPKLDEINDEDTSVENRRSLAFAAARAIVIEEAAAAGRPAPDVTPK